MTIDEFLVRLPKVKPVGPGQWKACCPAHEDRSPSLSVKLADDGKILVHCFGGCETSAICDSVGIEFTDLFPEKLSNSGPVATPIKFGNTGFTALDALRCLSHESALAASLAVELAEGRVLSPPELDRLATATLRLSVALAFVEENSCS